MTASRDIVVACARSWLGTPYHHAARVKGAGCDCLTLVASVYEEAGIVDRIEIPHYPPDWHLQRGAERYMNGVLEHAREVEGPAPGDLALWRFGRCFSHGAIVVRWPLVIHAYLGSCVRLEDAEAARWLATDGGRARPRRFFSPRAFG